MRIEGRQQGTRGEGLRPVRISVMADEMANGDGFVVVDTDGGRIWFDGNHAEALETAIRAARLELEARSKARP